jgi:hypothetical protein
MNQWFEGFNEDSGGLYNKSRTPEDTFRSRCSGAEPNVTTSSSSLDHEDSKGSPDDFVSSMTETQQSMDEPLDNARQTTEASNDRRTAWMEMVSNIIEAMQDFTTIMFAIDMNPTTQ